MKRLKKLYTWGDLSEEEYKEQRSQLQSELAALPPTTSSRKDMLERLANYLQDVVAAWRDATQEQRNRLAKTLFEGLRIENHTIRGVTPQIEFTPLLVPRHLNQNLHLSKRQGGGRKCGSDGGRTFTYDFSDLILHEQQEIVDPVPISQALCKSRYTMPLTQIPPNQWVELAQRHANGESLRQLAKAYAVSHEAIRQVLKKQAYRF